MRPSESTMQNSKPSVNAAGIENWEKGLTQVNLTGLPGFTIKK
jgi:hypothetical protein